jgi:hypothetical protein
VTTLYRTPNLVLDESEWHALVRAKAGRISTIYYFRPLIGPRRMWLPVTSWRGDKPCAREFAKKFQPFKRHMLQASRSVTLAELARVRLVREWAALEVLLARRVA